MPKEISLKLCLLNCLTENPVQGVERQVLASDHSRDRNRDGRNQLNSSSAGSSCKGRQ